MQKETWIKPSQNHAQRQIVPVKLRHISFFCFYFVFRYRQADQSLPVKGVYPKEDYFFDTVIVQGDFARFKVIV